jgi:hypothetical protein
VKLAAADEPSYHGCVVDVLCGRFELWNENFGGKMP